MKFDYEDSKGSSMGKDDYVKLKDGDSVKGVFVGAPVFWHQIWQPGGRPTIVPRFTKGASFRFRINLVVAEGGAYVAKVLEQGKTVWDTLKSLNDEYPLENYTMKVTRKGSGKEDTTYSVLPAAGGELTGEQKAKIAAVKLHDLKAPSIDTTQDGAAKATDLHKTFDEASRVGVGARIPER